MRLSTILQFPLFLAIGFSITLVHIFLSNNTEKLKYYILIAFCLALSLVLGIISKQIRLLQSSLPDKKNIVNLVIILFLIFICLLLKSQFLIHILFALLFHNAINSVEKKTSYLLILLSWVFLTDGRFPTTIILSFVIYFLFNTKIKLRPLVIFGILISFLIFLVSPLRNYFRFGFKNDQTFNYDNVYGNFDYSFFINKRLNENNVEKISNINSLTLESHTELYWQTFIYRDSISKILCDDYQTVLNHCDGITTPALGPLLSIIISTGGNSYLDLGIGAILVVFLFFTFPLISLIFGYKSIVVYFLSVFSLSFLDIGVHNWPYIFLAQIAALFVLLFNRHIFNKLTL